MKIEKLPTLEKGMYITAYQLETIFGYALDKRELGYLKSTIEQTTDFTVTTKNYGILVLDDLQAGDYNHKQLGQGLKKIFRRNIKMLQVDSSTFTKEDRETHDRRIEIQGKLTQGIEETLKKNAPINIDKHFPLQGKVPKIF